MDSYYTMFQHGNTETFDSEETIYTYTKVMQALTTLWFNC